MAARPPIHSQDPSLSLTMAVVASSNGPMLLLDGDLGIVAASASFCDQFEIDPAVVTGAKMLALGAGEWDVPQLRALLNATASGMARVESYEMDLKRQDRPTCHLVIHAQRLVYLDIENPRLLVAVCDVTESRADKQKMAEALARNGVLLQEVRHRVANSLQIVASVLMQNARRTASEETRGHLNDAHNRVMSIAALERQLSSSEEGQVEVRVYFTTLCDSIAASMIHDSTRISLSVEGNGAKVDARTSVSMGLIVTELVINALKHAFPNDRPGKIVLAYDFHGPNWSLRVRDDGVGMPTDPALIRVGLGTSIVQALAEQLEAILTVASAHPGTEVTLEHTQIALVEDPPVVRIATATRGQSAL